MAYIRMQNILGDCNKVESYILFRTIEDWCLDNIPSTAWHFDYSHTMDVYGVDLPIGIIFDSNINFTAFNHKFGNQPQVD